MIQPHYGGTEQPRPTLLRRIGSLLLMTGLGLNIWMLTTGEDLDFRLAMLVLSPGVILLFSTFLTDNTPSLRGCLSVLGILLAFMAAFWAWVGVTVALSPEDQPPEILREVLEPEPEEAPDEDEAELDEEPAEAAEEDALPSDGAEPQPEE